MSYEDYLKRKAIAARPTGIPHPADPPSVLFGYQRETVTWALRQGCAAVFFECGLGKTPTQLAWADQVASNTDKPVLILAPLAVSHQTEREGRKFGLPVNVCKEASDVKQGINITNYERLKKFNPADFGGVVLDESSILKSFMGATKRGLVEAFANTRFKLCCTATPAPNDYLELGNHSEFLDVLSSHEMIARWFLPDTSTFGTYTLKGHAIGPYWDWVASWARMAEKPSDLGFSDDGFELPELELKQAIVDVDVTKDRGATLFRIPDMSATSVHKEKRKTAPSRARAVADLVAAEPNEPWLIWCDTDYDAAELMKVLPSCAVEVSGKHKDEVKEDRLIGFSEGRYQILVSKPKLAGFGMNWQHCARVAFVGPSFSYEQFYQAVRRTWRLGQTRPVTVHVVLASTEKAVWDTLFRKSNDHDRMKREMRDAMRRAQAKSDERRHAYQPKHLARIPQWLKTG